MATTGVHSKWQAQERGCGGSGVSEGVWQWREGRGVAVEGGKGCGSAVGGGVACLS